MTEGKEILSIVGNIIDSYETKVKTVTSLITLVFQKIKDIQQEEISMAGRLKDILAKNRSLRRKDFDTMISDIQLQQTRREKEINRIVRDICQEEKETVTKLRELITGKSPSAFEEFMVLKMKMLEQPKERERKLIRMLKNFHQDQQQLCMAFRKLLEKGPSIRIKDFRAMIKAFRVEHQEEISGIDEILEELERVREDINSRWQKVIATAEEGMTAPL